MRLIEGNCAAKSALNRVRLLCRTRSVGDDEMKRCWGGGGGGLLLCVEDFYCNDDGS